MHYLGTTAVILYIILIPESPKFLFVNDRREEGIAALNRIAVINRSTFRVPPNAKLDIH